MNNIINKCKCENANMKYGYNDVKDQSSKDNDAGQADCVGYLQSKKCWLANPTIVFFREGRERRMFSIDCGCVGASGLRVDTSIWWAETCLNFSEGFLKPRWKARHASFRKYVG